MIKPRPSQQCKKVECARHESYKRWQCGDSNLNYCMACKWSHVSQYKKKAEEG